MIHYLNSSTNINPEMLQGFCVGWRAPISPEKHLQVLKNSDAIFLAFDTEKQKVVGFITALTDHVQAVFIPLLEVLPEYQKQGIGSELVKRMLARFSHLPAIDLTCDPDVQDFYKKLGMKPSVGMVVRNY